MPTALPKEKKLLIIEWLKQPRSERQGLKDLAHDLHVHRSTIAKVQVEWESQQKADKEVEERAEKIKKNAARGFFDDNIVPERKRRIGKLTPEQEVEQMIQRLREIAMDDKNSNTAATNAARTFLQARGALVEKQEHKIEVSTDDTIRQRLEATKQLREQGYRMVEMPVKPPLLSGQVLVDNGQGATGDNQVGEVGISSESPK